MSDPVIYGFISADIWYNNEEIRRKQMVAGP